MLMDDTATEFGSAFHSQGADETDGLEDTDVYVDLGDDPPEALDDALAAAVGKARFNGMSAEGAEKLAELLNKYKSIFD